MYLSFQTHTHVPIDYTCEGTVVDIRNNIGQSKCSLGTLFQKKKNLGISFLFKKIFILWFL